MRTVLKEDSALICTADINSKTVIAIGHRAISISGTIYINRGIISCYPPLLFKKIKTKNPNKTKTTNKPTKPPIAAVA